MKTQRLTALSLASLLATLLLPLAAFADFTYTTWNNEVTITEYTGPGGAVVIPSTLGGNPVRVIGRSAFRGNTAVTSVVIPNSVTTIDGGFASPPGHNVGSFMGCTGLTSVTIGSGVTSIGASAFSFCPNLKYVKFLGNRPSTMHSSMFESSSLVILYRHIDATGWGSSEAGRPVHLWQSGAPNYGYLEIEGGVSISGFFGTVGASVSIPDSIDGLSVREISGPAFRNLPQITSLTIPDSITSIGSNAFDSCTGLTSVTIGNSVTSIGSSAFFGCSGLNALVIPDSVHSIGSSAFRNCTGLTSISIGSGVTSIGNNAFEGCTNLPALVIPNNVTSIGSSVFRNCSALTSVSIGTGVTSIGANAFENCSAITHLVIPDNVTSIGNFAFRNCSGLLSVVIGSGVISIGQDAFRNCQNLASVTLGNSVASIGLRAFFDCPALEHITIPASLQTVGNDVFRGTTALKTATLYSVPANLFTGVSTLEQVQIMNGAASIGGNAFKGCSGLTSVAIPHSVLTIGNDAFADCPGLTQVDLPPRFLPSLTHIGFSPELAGNTLIRGIATSDQLAREKMLQPVAAAASSGPEMVVAPDSAIHHLTITGSGPVELVWDLSGLPLDGQAVTWEAWITVENAQAQLRLPEPQNTAELRVLYLAGGPEPETTADGETLHTVWRAFRLGSQTVLVCNQWLQIDPAP